MKDYCWNARAWRVLWTGAGSARSHEPLRKAARATSKVEPASNARPRARPRHAFLHTQSTRCAPAPFVVADGGAWMAAAAQIIYKPGTEYPGNV